MTKSDQHEAPQGVDITRLSPFPLLEGRLTKLQPGEVDWSGRFYDNAIIGALITGGGAAALTSLLRSLRPAKRKRTEVPVYIAPVAKTAAAESGYQPATSGYRPTASTLTNLLRLLFEIPRKGVNLASRAAERSGFGNGVTGGGIDLLTRNPLITSIGIPATLGAGMLGYGSVKSLADRMMSRAQEKELEEARREFREALSSQAVPVEKRGAVSDAAYCGQVLDELYDQHCKQADVIGLVGAIPRALLTLMLLSATTAAAARGIRGYNTIAAERKRREQEIARQDALVQRTLPRAELLSPGSFDVKEGSEKRAINDNSPTPPGRNPVADLIGKAQGAYQMYKQYNDPVEREKMFTQFITPENIEKYQTQIGNAISAMPQNKLQNFVSGIWGRLPKNVQSMMVSNIMKSQGGGGALAGLGGFFTQLPSQLAGWGQQWLSEGKDVMRGLLGSQNYDTLFPSV